MKDIWHLSSKKFQEKFIKYHLKLVTITQMIYPLRNTNKKIQFIN